MRAIGLDRVVSRAGVLPQAAQRLDASAEIAPYEVRVGIERSPTSAPRAWPPT